MKRFFIISALLFTLLISFLAGFVYLFDINNHPQWITEQIEKSTGYQVDFESIENNYWQESRFLVSGVSVALGKKELLHIDKVNIVISKLDLWDQKLELQLVELIGVDLSVEANTFKKIASESKKVGESDNNIQVMPWSRLHLNKLRITGLNAEISNVEQSLRLQQASLSSDNLTIIEGNKLAAALLKGNLQLDVKKLALQYSAVQGARFEDLSLHSDFDLTNLQAKLSVAIKQLAFTLPEQGQVVVDKSLLELHLDKNRLSLTHLSANAFSGELQLQAEALLSFDLFPAPELHLDNLTILSLLAKDMLIQIPAFLPEFENEELDKADQKQKLAIKTLLLKQIDLQNITINSEGKQIPLTVKGLNCHLQDFYLLQNNQLVRLSELKNQAGLFTLQFAALQWEESVTEQFQAAGSFSEDTQSLLILKELLRLDGK